MSAYFLDIAHQPFTVPQEICPGDSAQFRCTVEDVSGQGTTFWTVTVNGTEDNCTLAHIQPNDTDTCGPNNQFESYLNNPVGNSYSSTLTVCSRSACLNGTCVECAASNLTVIGTSSICIIGKKTKELLFMLVMCSTF